MASNWFLMRKSKDEHDFWDSFWLHSESLVKCDECRYIEECLAVPDEFPMKCGQFLEKKYREYVEEEYE